MAKISVITSVYNAEKFIKESIDSILSQTFTDFEFIIINDGSTDASHFLIAEYQDNRILYINNPCNRGSVPCLHEAILLANSDLIAIHDADDVSKIERLYKQFSFMENNADIFCVGGFARKIDESGFFSGEWTFPPTNHDEIVSMLFNKRKSPIINPTSMFRKQDYLRIGGYSFEKSVVASYDLDLWTKAVLHKKRFANINEFLIDYRWHKNSMTQRLKKQQIAAYNKIMSNFIRKYKNESAKKMDRGGTQISLHRET